jgi:tetratricopeptide (TPR) repeat protein
MKQWLKYLLIVSTFISCKSLFKKSKPISYDDRKKFDHLYYEASKQKALGNFDVAYKSFEQALKIDAANHAVMYQLANINFKQKKLTDAIYWAEKSVKANPEYNHWYYGQLGQFYNKEGSFLKAAGVFEKMIDSEPGRVSNYTETANQYLNAGKFTEAAKILNQYQDKFGVDEESARKLEQIYMQLKKPDKALAEILKLTIAYPDEVRFWGLLGETQMNLGKYEEAKKSYEQILKLDSNNGYAFFGLAELCRQKDDAKGSFEYLLKGFRDERVDMQNKLGVISSYYILLKKDKESKDQAFRLGEALIETHPTDALSYIVYSDLLYAIADYGQSREYLLKSFEFETSDFRVWQKLLTIDEKLDSSELIEMDSKRAIEYFPNVPVLYIYNGFSLNALGRYLEAVKISEEGLSFAIQLEERVQLHLTIADAYNSLKDHEKSDKAFDEILKLEPGNALALNNYAYYLSLRKTRLTDAGAMAKKALQKEPNNPSYLDTYGWVLFQLENFADAEKAVKKAMEFAPDNSEILEHYGDIIYKQGDSGKAMFYWKKAKENGGKSDELEKKINTGILD